MDPVVWCFGTAAPATVLLHGAHHSLTVGGIAGVAWLLAPGSAIERLRRLVGGAAGSRTTLWAALAVLGSGAAALVHLLVVPGHLRVEAGPWLAPGFVVVAVLQAAWAYAVARRADAVPPRLLEAGVALHAGSLLVWLASRTVGLPEAILPGGTAVVGIPDLVVALWQLLALVAVRALLRRSPRAEHAGGAPGGTRGTSLLAWSAWPAPARVLVAVAGASTVALTTSGGLL